MMNKKIWLSAPHMGGGEMKYITDAFNENWIAPLGPNVNGLEKDLERFLGKGVHVAALSSGTAAIHLSLVLLGVEAGDYVICQSLTFSASANPIKYIGAEPIFVDSEPDTWNLCPQALEDAIKFAIAKNKKPKAIIAVCLYGMPYKIDEITEIAERYEIPVIEDSAEALGSMYKNRRCGTFGDLGVLSFNGNKIITTSGGGALTLKNIAFKKQAVFLSTQAKDDAPHYEHTSIGYNYRMSNICAGIGRGQMEVLDERVVQRRANHQFYLDHLQDNEWMTIHTEPSPDFFSNHWLTVALVKSQGDISAKKLMQTFAQQNIETRPLWKPMHMQPVFKKYKYFGAHISDELFKSGICLPSGSSLEDDDRGRIMEVLDGFLNKK